jgi:hypothetical protein
MRRNLPRVKPLLYHLPPSTILPRHCPALPTASSSQFRIFGEIFCQPLNGPFQTFFNRPFLTRYLAEFEVIENFF